MVNDHPAVRARMADYKSAAPLNEEFKEVKKRWGRERWIVNCRLYCSKLIYLDKGAQSSYHYHKKKQETFYCLDGQASLRVNDRDYLINPFARPKTIKPGMRHSFFGLTKAIILEVSTMHDDKDVYRITESIKSGGRNDS